MPAPHESPPNTQKYVYLSVIQDINNKIISVQGLKSIKNKKEFFAVETDKFQISYSDVVAVVPQPTLQVKNCQLTYIFSKKLAVKRKI